LNLISGVDSYLSSGLLPLYYLVVVIINLALLIKFKGNKLALFIILIFSEGLFAYLGNLIPIFSYTYKIGFFVLGLILFHRPLFLSKKTKKEKVLIGVFILIALHFLVSGYLNNTDLTITLSQVFRKYFLLVLFFFGVKRIQDFQLIYIGKVLIWVFVSQIFFTGIKLILFGFGESLIGSISFDGGGPSNILPVLGFLFIFIRRNGKMERKDWYLVLALFLVAVVGNKRSIMILLPAIVVSTYWLVQKSFSFLSIFKYLPIAFFLLYFGVKTNPSLNPELSRWGSFDVTYLYDYTVGYTFGSSDVYKRDDLASGRGGAFLALFKSEFNLSDNSYLIGEGYGSILGDYEDFEHERYGIASKGSAGAAVQNYISLGYIGTILIFVFSLVLASLFNNNGLRIIMLLFLSWDYILFYNSTISINAMGITLIIIIVYANRFYGIEKWHGGSNLTRYNEV
jgi:hypothetical protein